MKKRSLVAALAMLVVSAIVLTSSTYAWFATSSAAAVDKFSASVTNNSGSLTVQAAGTNKTNEVKKTTLTSADFSGLATNLQPVSLYLDADNAVVINKVAYDAAKFDTFTAATQNLEYLCYEFNAEYVNGNKENKTVTLTPEFTAEEDFLYGLVAVTADGSTKYFVYDAISGGYTAVKALSGDVKDDNGNSIVKDTNGNNIIDSGDEGYKETDMETYFGTSNNGTGKATSTTSATVLDIMEVTAGTTETANIKVYVWAEGQDSNCSGNVSTAAAGFDFELGIK